MGSGVSSGVSTAVSVATEEDLRVAAHALSANAREKLSQGLQELEAPEPLHDLCDEDALLELDALWEDVAGEAQRLADSSNEEARLQTLADAEAARMEAQIKAFAATALQGELLADKGGTRFKDDGEAQRNSDSPASSADVEMDLRHSKKAGGRLRRQSEPKEGAANAVVHAVTGGKKIWKWPWSSTPASEAAAAPQPPPGDAAPGSAGSSKPFVPAAVMVFDSTEEEEGASELSADIGDASILGPLRRFSSGRRGKKDEENKELGLSPIMGITAVDPDKARERLQVSSNTVEYVKPMGFGGGYDAAYQVQMGGIACVAKKVYYDPGFSTGKTDSAEIIALFRALKKIQHANIIKLVGVITDEPEYLVKLTELAPLGCLGRFLDENRDKVKQQLGVQRQLLRGIAAGMACLHSQSPPMLHTDLSSDNIMIFPDTVTRGYTPKLRDIGEVREGMDAPLKYAPPEFFDGAKLSMAGEVFAYAIICYEVLRAQIISRQPRLSDLEHVPGRSRELIPLAEACWRQEPHRRPTFAEIRDCKLLAEPSSPAPGPAFSDEVPESRQHTSGESEPPRARIMFSSVASPASEKISTKLLSRLSVFDRTLAAALRKGLVRLISCEYLLKQEDGWKLPRLQELSQTNGALLEPRNAVALLEEADRRIFAVSHGWLSKGSPDPHGVRVKILRGYLLALQDLGALPAGAGLFWDYGSLPQKPRTGQEEDTFRQALKIMGDVYASPLGTAVIQVKPIPPRPTADDGRVLACELNAKVDTATLVQALSVFGELRECESITDKAADVGASYVLHEDAVKAADFSGHEKLLGDGAFVCLQYNDRPYEQRGWCVAEEMFSTECLLRLPLPSLPRPKVVSLLQGGEAVEVKPRERSVKDVEDNIGRAMFTGKGDRKTVLQIYLTYQRRLSSSDFSEGEASR